MEITIKILELIAVLSSAMFTGAAVYISFVEHPARMSCGTELAITEFIPSYRRATVMQASLALISFFSAILVGIILKEFIWILAGLIIGIVIPFTIFLMMPTNKALENESLDKSSLLARQLLTKWGKLHFVRSFLSFISLLIQMVLSMSDRI